MKKEIHTTSKEPINKTKIAFAINIAIILAEIFAAIIGAIEKWDEYKFKFFAYYTQDSNIVLLIACLIMSIEQGRVLFGEKRVETPRYAQMLKYIATSMVTLTFLVVVFVLIPYAGINSAVEKLFCGASLYHHFLCPVMAFVSFVFFEKEPKLKFIDTLCALIPTIVYAVIIVILNLCRVITGPYPFLKVYEQPVYASILWVFAILGGAYAIAVGTYFAHKGKQNKHNKNSQEKGDLDYDIQRGETK